MAAIHLLKKINNVITAQVGLRLGIQFKSANPQNTLFYTSNLRIKFRSFQGIISAQRPRKPRERPFASPQTVRPAADPLPVCKCGQPKRKMYTRLDYRERSHRVTSWSHISSQFPTGAGCSAAEIILPSLASLLYSLHCSFTSTCTLPTELRWSLTWRVWHLLYFCKLRRQFHVKIPFMKWTSCVCNSLF